MNFHFRKLLPCLVLLTLFCQKVQAQRNFIQGVIVTSQGDSISGLIDYQNWFKNPDEIDFKRIIDGEIISFNSFDLNSFAVDDEVYVSALTDVELSPFRMEGLNGNSALNLESKRVFLQTVINGKKSLYHYKDANGKDHFYIKMDGEYTLLRHKRYLKNKQIQEIKTYQGQLGYYLTGCTAIESKIKNLKFGKRYFENLFVSYYKCTGDKIDFRKETERIKSSFGLLAGLSVSSVSFESGSFINAVSITDFSSSVNASFGVYMESQFSRQLGKWSLQNELFFSSYELSGQVATYNSATFTTIRYDSRIGYSYIKLNNMLRYTYRSQRFVLYLNAGISNGMAITETNSQHKEITLINSTRTEDLEAVPNARKYEQGLLFGIGTRFNKYSIEARIERGNGMWSGSGIKSRSTRLFLLLGYSL